MTASARLVVVGPLPGKVEPTDAPHRPSPGRLGGPEEGRNGHGRAGALVLAAVLLTAVVVQVAVAPRLALAGATPDLLLLAVAAVAVACGRRAGAAFGFAAGLATDLFVATPAGISALIFTLVGHATAVAVRPALWGRGAEVTGSDGARPARRTRRARWRAAAAVAGATSLAGGLLMGVAATVAGGVPFSPAAALVRLAVGAAVAAVLGAPVFAAVAAVTGGGRRRSPVARACPPSEPEGGS